MSPAILIIKPSSLGDVAVALAVVPALRAHYPDATIDWLANREYVDLVAATEDIHTVHAFARGSWRRLRSAAHGLANFARLVGALRRAHYDIVIDLQGLLRSAWFTCLTTAPIRVGFADAREGAYMAYNRRVQVDRNATHAVDCCLAAVETLTGRPCPAQWHWRASTKTGSVVPARLGLPPRGFVVYVLGTRWASKCWDAAQAGALIDSLWQRDHQPVVLTGSASEKEVAAQVIAAARERGCPNEALLDTSGQLGLVELLRLFQSTRLVITPDSGPMHLAVAAGARVVAIMGPTSPVRHGPYGQLGNVVAAPRNHAPCYRRVCVRGEQCMRRVSACDVLAKVEQVLERGDDLPHSEETT